MTTTGRDSTLVSLPTNLWTIHDVLLGSPVWKANILHLEEQIDHFEKWVDGFTRALKQYVDAIVKYNTQTSDLCKRTLPQNLDGSLIDPQIAGMIINTFAGTLQCHLAFKTKLASDLQDTLLHPLQRFMKNELKAFKEAKRNFERLSERYDWQMTRYGALSKTKEASALREDAFQTFDVQKSYLKGCRDYFEQLIVFKTNIEHVLVGCFSAAMGAQIEEIDESLQSSKQARAMLPGWQQWLGESKATSQYQLSKISKAANALESNFVHQTRPDRSLQSYVTSSNTDTANGQDNIPIGRSLVMKPGDSGNLDYKEGYLYTRIIVGVPARYSWVRRWFFVQDGWFGSCTVDKAKAYIVVSDRIKMEHAEYHVNNDIDRRFCFEVSDVKSTLLLQAATEDEMQEWLCALDAARNQQGPSENSMTEQPWPLLCSEPVSETAEMYCVASSSPLLKAFGEVSSKNRAPNNRTTISRLVSILLQNAPTSSPAYDTEEEVNGRTTPSAASRSVSGTPAMSPRQSTGPISTSATSSPWTVPWIMSGMNALSSTGSDVYYNASDAGAARTESGAVIVWPTKIEMEANEVKLSGYTGELACRQRELRRLFAHVPKSDIVLESFTASLYRKPSGVEDETEYAYSGHAYITQTRLWFFSCAMMTCVNALMIPLERIKSIRLERTLATGSHGMLLYVETKSDTPRTFCFGVWLEPAELIGERLRIAVEATKKMDPIDLQELYDSMKTVVPGSIKPKPSIGQIIPATGPDASVTAITVQTRPSPAPVRSVSEPEETSTAADALMEAASKSTMPKGPVHCGCKDHLDKIEAKVKLGISAKQLFDYMFSDKEDGSQSIWHQLNACRRNSAPIMTSWATSPEGKKARTLKYAMPTNNPMAKIRETEVIETQETLREEEPTCYVVLCSTQTPQLPYADAFIPRIKYCITYETPDSCLLTCSIGITWLKTIMVKSMISRAATKGMSDTIKILISLIQRNVRYLGQPGTTGKVAAITQDQRQEVTGTYPKEAIWRMRAGWIFALFITVAVLCILPFLRRSHHELSTIMRDNDGSNNTSTQIVWRGVFIRDLEQELNGGGQWLNKANSRLYRRFKDHDIVWYDPHHRMMAADIHYTRERLGALRFNLLTAFRMLNEMDQKLWENEYRNWLLDQRVGCDESNCSEILKEFESL